MSTELSMMVGRLPAAEGVALFTDAQFKYDALLGNRAPIFKPVTRVSNKVKFVAVFVDKASYNATPVAGICDRSGFGQGNKEGIRREEFNSQLYDYSGELCYDDLMVLCDAWENSTIYRLQNPMGAFQSNILLQLVFGLKYQTMLDDIVRIGWYSKAGAFAVNTLAGSAPFYIGAVPNRANVMLGNTQSGFWELAQLNVAATRTPYVDVNNGSAAGNILNPANVYSILQKFIDNASPELRGIEKGTANSPFFMVDNAVFDSLRNYYILNGVNTHNDLAWQMQQMAVDTLMFNGYRVYRDNNADKFDTEIGAKTTSTIGGKSVTHSRNCRVVFTVPGAAFLGLDMATPSGDTIGLIVAPAADQVKDAGTIYWKMMTSVGVFIGEPKMMVVGYPSVATTWQ
jgi:hypothetical protein